MSTTTLGIKVDDTTKQRLKEAAEKIDRSPHWLLKHAALDWLSRIDTGATLTDLIREDLIERDHRQYSISLRAAKQDLPRASGTVEE